MLHISLTSALAFEMSNLRVFWLAVMLLDLFFLKFGLNLPGTLCIMYLKQDDPCKGLSF